MLAVTAFIHQYSSPRVTLITINRYHKILSKYDMISIDVTIYLDITIYLDVT